jgi:hypothetical protein
MAGSFTAILPDNSKWEGTKFPLIALNLQQGFGVALAFKLNAHSAP